MNQSDIIKKWNMNYSDPVVSVCCATYNHAGMIKKALDSVLSQDVDFPYEILIYDDASTDGTSEIIDKYIENFGKIVKVQRQSTNQYSQGVRVNFVYNFPRAKGKYIAFCEGDDMWIDKNKMSTQVEFLEKNNEAILSFHRVTVKNNNKSSEAVRSVVRNFQTEDCSSSDLIYGRCQIPTVSIMFRNIKNIDWKSLPFHGVMGGDLIFQSILGHYGYGIYNEKIKPSIYLKHAGGAWSSLTIYRRKYEGIINRVSLCRYYNIIGDQATEKQWINELLIYVINTWGVLRISKKVALIIFRKIVKLIKYK